MLKWIQNWHIKGIAIKIPLIDITLERKEDVTEKIDISESSTNDNVLLQPISSESKKSKHIEQSPPRLDEQVALRSPLISDFQSNKKEAKKLERRVVNEEKSFTRKLRDKLCSLEQRLKNIETWVGLGRKLRVLLWIVFVYSIFGISWSILNLITFIYLTIVTLIYLCFIAVWFCLLGAVFWGTGGALLGTLIGLVIGWAGLPESFSTAWENAFSDVKEIINKFMQPTTDFVANLLQIKDVFKEN